MKISTFSTFKKKKSAEPIRGNMVIQLEMQAQGQA